MTESKRAAIYTRIGQEAGVDKTANQEADLRKLSGEFGYTVADVLTDDDLSAYKRVDRPGWTRMLAGLKDGKYDVVMASAPDRSRVVMP